LLLLLEAAAEQKLQRAEVATIATVLAVVVCNSINYHSMDSVNIMYLDKGIVFIES